MSVTPMSETLERPRKTSRRLRPEVAAALAARKRRAQLQELYEKPVEDLAPEEVARMKAAFFRS